MDNYTYRIEKNIKAGVTYTAIVYKNSLQIAIKSRFRWERTAIDWAVFVIAREKGMIA